MKAVVIKGLKQVEVEDRPVPTLQSPGDIIVKTHISGLCGSDLHNYRQAEEGTGFILGHEVVGEVVEVGQGVKKFKQGDIVSAPFSICCGECWFCKKGYTARCPKAQFFGCPSLDGCQAEYVRIPMSEASVYHVPPSFSKESMLLLSDIFSTGYSSAYNARRLLDEDDQRDNLSISKGSVVVVYGCGPVGLCAISSALTMFDKVIATDPNPARREIAQKHGAIALEGKDVKDRVMELTDGRGADAALDLVGGETVLKLCLEIIRSYGAVSSIGMQPRSGTMDYPLLYEKNARLQFGRCNVRQFVPLAAKVLEANQELFNAFITNRVRFDQAPEYYELFNDGKVGKTVFVADNLPLERS